jgi:hypothetical protein
MSVKSKILKIAIKLTPSPLIVWVSNFVLKGIAELTAFNFDVDARKVYVQTRLYGEEFTIDVHVEDFALFKEGDSYRVIINHASSDRPWLNNILAHITGKAWKIPAIPQLAAPLDIVAELFAVKTPEA